MSVCVCVCVCVCGCTEGRGEQRRNCMSYNKPAVGLWGMWGLCKNVAILDFLSIPLSFTKTSSLLLQTAINNAIFIIMW